MFSNSSISRSENITLTCGVSLFGKHSYCDLLETTDRKNRRKKQILKIYAQKQPVNLLTLIELMRNNGELEKINIEYIFMFTEIAHTTAYAPYYAKVIKEKSDLRKLTNIAQKIIATAEKGIASPIDIISSVSNEFLNFKDSTKEEFSTVGKYLASDFLKHVENHKKYNDRSYARLR